MHNVFVDSDVILDLLLKRQPFFQEATRFFMLVQDKKVRAQVSPLIFSNLFYILRKEISSEKAIIALRKLRTLTGVLPVDEQTVDMALSSSFKDFEDAIQYYAASSNNAEAIITRNKKDYGGSKIPVLTAGEWLDLHEAQIAGDLERPRGAGPKPSE